MWIITGRPESGNDYRPVKILNWAKFDRTGAGLSSWTYEKSEAKTFVNKDDAEKIASKFIADYKTKVILLEEYI